MKILLNYNFNAPDIDDEDFISLFESKRRDSCFAFAYQKGNNIYAMRDHIGTVPLYFRFINNEVRFSITLKPLVDKSCQLDLEGLRYLIAFGSPKLKPLFKEIMVVPPGSVMKINPETRQTQIIYRHRFKIPKLPLRSMSACVDKLDELLLQAVKRTVKFNKVGLYLSGGIDSALNGIYLKKLGVKVNAYTSAPWGHRFSGIPFAKTNAAVIGVDNHYIDFLETDKYQKAVSSIPDLYDSPHVSTTAIGVASLWKDFPLKNEQQIYGSEGCDIIAGAVPAQYISYFLNFFPKFIRQKLHKNMKYNTLLQNYLSFKSNDLVNNDEEFFKAYIDPKLPKTAQISLTASYIGQTPQGGEAISGPVMKHNIIYSNPFYDTDLMEFLLAIPLRLRVAFSRKKRTKIYLDKLVVRKLAERYLPKELIYRKKGFTVSLARDERTREIMADVPQELLGLSLIDDELKFRARIFLDWCKNIGVKLNY